MKRIQSVIIYWLASLLWLLPALLFTFSGCAFYSKQPVVRTAISPNGKYKITFEEQSDIPTGGLFYRKESHIWIESNGKMLLENKLFTAGHDHEPGVIDKYPTFDWVSEKVLRLSDKPGSMAAHADEVALYNQSGKPIIYVRLITAPVECFIPIDLQPNENIKLPLQSDSSPRLISVACHFANDPDKTLFREIPFDYPNEPNKSLHYCVTIKEGDISIGCKECTVSNSADNCGAIPQR